MDDLGSVLALTVPAWEVMLRGSVTFLGLMLLFRVLGQREEGGLGLTDLLLVVLVADAASAGLTGEASSVGDGFVLVGTLLFWSVLFDALSYRFPALGRVLKARRKALIRDGQLNRSVMRRELMTLDEVMSQLRLHGIEDLDQVRRAYLEPNGLISVLAYDGEDSEEAQEPPQPV